MISLIKMDKRIEQHPRDIFDTSRMLDSPGYSAEIHSGFLFCLLSSKRPIHEILDPGYVNQQAVLESQFSGMTDVEFTYEMYKAERLRLLSTVIAHLKADDKVLLNSFAAGDPIWHDRDLSIFPGIRWKLMNIRRLKTINKQKFKQQLEQLEKVLNH